MAGQESRTYVVAGIRPWSREVFEEVVRHYPGQWHYIDSPEELMSEKLQALDPRYIFFPHWSWKVPQEIIEAYECVAFHMTDLPYGRGGTPLQNLILRGHRETKLTAFRMTTEFDAGPVYLKEDLDLSGNAEDIYRRTSSLAAAMIRHLIDEEPDPFPQEGDVVEFKRRRPEESEIPEVGSLSELHDFVRMLDAEGYPRAFFVRGRFRYELRDASLEDDRIKARVTVTPRPEKDDR